MVRVVWGLPVALSLGFAPLAYAGPQSASSPPATAPAEEAQPVDDDDDLTLEQVPEAVRRAIVKEVADGRIEDIERDREKGQIVYEVEYETKDGVEYKAHFAEDGRLLKKKKD